MSILTLKLTRSANVPLDLSPLLPERLAGMTLDAIARIKLDAGADRVEVGEIFKCSGQPGEQLRLSHLTNACYRLGAGMTGGAIEARGCFGAELGREMSGGIITFNGDVGDAAGVGMRGGLMRINGHVGDRLGGPTPGATRGMNGGTILVSKSAGIATAQRMRRGLISISGACGASAAERMIAGTLMVFGDCAAQPGLGMRRGTLMLANPTSPPSNVFNDCGTFELAFVPTFINYLKTIDPLIARHTRPFLRTRRWAGDLAHGGKGEILVPEPE